MDVNMSTVPLPAMQLTKIWLIKVMKKLLQWVRRV